MHRCLIHNTLMQPPTIGLAIKSAIPAVLDSRNLKRRTCHYRLISASTCDGVLCLRWQIREDPLLAVLIGRLHERVEEGMWLQWL